MEIRAITEDENLAFRAALMSVFGMGDPAVDTVGHERHRALVAPGRAWAAFDRGTIVATAATFDFTLTVPGGAIEMAGLTQVTVRPTHRRRGILRALIELHLAEARARRVPLSGLWASEASIYGRFGYGVAAESEDTALSSVVLEAPAGDGDELEPLVEAAPEVLKGVYEAVRAARPGMITRTPAWWTYRRFMERPGPPPSSPRRFVLARRGGAATGYVSYRQRLGWEEGVAAGTAEIEELVAVDARAERTLLRFICEIDLFRKVSWWNMPTDSLLPWLVTDPRRVRRRRVDTLWLRPDDLEAVLAARRYPADGALRLEVEGRALELRVEDGFGRCHEGGGAPQLRLGRAQVGNLVLGAFAPSLLARAGLVSGEPAALALADRMFAWPVAPWIAEVF